MQIMVSTAQWCSMYACMYLNEWIVGTLGGSVHISKWYLLSGVITQARP